MGADSDQALASLPEIGRKELVGRDYSPGKNVPWWTKLGSKLILARLPVPYAVWRRLGIFKHGRSDARWTRERKFATECLELAARAIGRVPRSTLELGPGDSLVGAMVAAAQGVEDIAIVDVGDFATVEVERYRPLVEDLEKAFPGFAKRVDLSSRERLLESIQARYFIHGLEDMASLPSGSVELAFSLKVMEHVRRREFAPLMSELARLSAPVSIQRHVVDLHDHMGCSLNNLRFSEGFWEHPVVSKSGFYTNRLRCSQIASMARESGFQVTVPHALIWPAVPVSRRKMHAAFRSFADADLQVCMFDMVLAKVDLATQSIG
jgi:hypothetical protein